MLCTVLLSQIILTLFCQAFCFVPTEEDLKCFNDFETEMKCSLSGRLKSCSGYKLNIAHSVLENCTCIFAISQHSDNCECKIKVQGFVSKADFNTTLLEGTNVLLEKTFKTEDFIKPKSPVLSVQKTENGNFNGTRDDRYEKRGLEDLRINVTYGIKEGHENISKAMQNTVGLFKIMGENLQPNTNYIVTATVSTAYNNHNISSDQSKPVEFTTPISQCERAKMLIPPLCFGVIIIILSVFFCILRIKINWWDKISKPEIDDLGEKGHILPLSVMKFSPIHVEIPTMDLQEDQAFPDLTKSTEGQWSTSISTEQALNACGALKSPPSPGQDPTSVQQSPPLHIPPVIQMDSSYQCV